ncbi:hypothetical protein MA20_32130 [Bradyrhizobium japonicum]|uniref:Uncharacterized protein n=1 Tax=Bradyrhizobium japonicum TaxID=375 RepID=A0A0A3YQ70_BRAJP|nr:hypothetical protein [Bradyrhizobium japonicum]KGT75838.1 hypothetical protein MA20_32130 [Bradyrhizobium japonicum]
MNSGWLHVRAKRVLSVDRGKTTILCDRDHPTELMILVGDEPSAAPVGPLNFFSENVDAWGAAEWFNRLAIAIRRHDAAVRDNDDAVVEICRNVAASSAMRLVRDYEQQVRAALSPCSAETERHEIPETVTPDGLRARANIMRENGDESCARHLELAAAKIDQLSPRQLDAETDRVTKPRPDLSTVAKRNAFYSSEEYRNMTTAEKCAVQGDGFLNDYD